MGAAGWICLFFFFRFTPSVRLLIVLLAVALGLQGAPAPSQRQSRVQIRIVPVAAAERQNEAGSSVRREQAKVTLGVSVSPDDAPLFSNSNQSLEGSCPVGSSVSLLEDLFSPGVSSSRLLEMGKVTTGASPSVKVLPGSSDSGPVSFHPSLSPASSSQSERITLTHSVSAELPTPVGKTKPSSLPGAVSSINATAFNLENSSQEDFQAKRLSRLVGQFPSFSSGASRLTSTVLGNDTGTHAPVSPPPHPVSLSRSSFAASPTPSSPSGSRSGTVTAFFSDSGPASPRSARRSESGKSLHEPTVETEHGRDQRDGRVLAVYDETNEEDGEKAEDEALLTVTTENFDTLLSKYRIASRSLRSGGASPASQSCFLASRHG
ncbi:hypothetical protein CSUI_004902 [Cystoisospora suis]|uniref:Transmembrane protein n=1 Tax=Cystoisospora suis TaxID=483139 RepID=A0A2C6KZB1_9APIC|nr:hypothetical protein CSUI_004902 [Cystoisospora suis]